MALLVVKVLDESSSLSGIATIRVVGTVAREMTVFATLETKTLSAGSVNVHRVGVSWSGCSWYRGLVVILRTRGVPLEETPMRRHRGRGD